MNNIVIKDIGTFEVNCGQLVVSDPCYKPPTNDSCSLLIKNVLNGTWCSSVVRGTCPAGWGNRVMRLMAWNKDSRRFSEEHIEDPKEIGEVGVDSGQMSIVNAVDYPEFNGPTGYEPEAFEEGNFYGDICNNNTYKGPHVFKGGCSSDSGYGDGGYPVYEYRNASGQCTALEVVFIREDEDLQ